ncbi:hypothetical protein SAMN02927937_02379 [Paenimyroides aquimaris]|uniref:Uncharacterized protein n=1 Tax=Paenimyroides marinum TaxID=1159016 RepID=A0A1H6M9U9_9FLAO|nr:hypothetical protein [Paenimyroides aquimaris]SEH95768.1 hypothetical protein SAMN02927937_02379 [Paenimyroides aquimaris]
MSVLTKDNFPEIKSEPNWFWTWCIRVVFFLLFGLIVLLFYALPFLFYIDGTIEGRQLFVFGIIYYPIVIWLSYIAVRYLIRIKSKAVRHITVNREGIFYEQLDGTVESLLYSQLAKSSNDFNIYDIFIGSNRVYTGTTTYSQTFLKVFLKGNEQKVRFFHPDVAYSYYARNSRLLRSHFIQGVTLFRPDLRIAPHVYSEFSIHPETFDFDKKEYWKAIVIAIIFIILVFIGIEWYMKYRFGYSLIF